MCRMATKKEFKSFEEMLFASDVPVLVDFYADWCGPCQMMVPILEQVNAQLSDRLRIVKIDTEKYTDLATQYKIASLPTLVLFKQGQPVERIEGVMQAPELVQYLQTMI
jgi:thioredoxin